MNLNTNSFFNSTDIHISSRMNEYLKKNFGYEVEGDFDTLKEAKQSLEAEQVELKSDYMSAKYIENMLMIETITSLLKSHGESTSPSHKQEEVVSEETPEEVTEEDEEEKPKEHYRWKNASQLSMAEDKLEACIADLDVAINYRAENSHKFFNTGDKAGTGDLYRMKEQLEKLRDGWAEATELYGM